jgi:hypothetical protein
MVWSDGLTVTSQNVGDGWVGKNCLVTGHQQLLLTNGCSLGTAVGWFYIQFDKFISMVL